MSTRQAPGRLGDSMPPKKLCTAQQAQEFGDLAVAKATNSFGRDGLPAAAVLHCAYRGIATPDGGGDLAGPILAKTILVFEWSLAGEILEETDKSHVRADHAAKQGILFPATWTTALKCLHMSTLVGSALEAARQESDAAEVGCEFLGPARMATLSDSEDIKPGATLMLETCGTRMAHILCSWIRDSVSFCHRGTFDDCGRLDKYNPFDERSLVNS